MHVTSFALGDTPEVRQRCADGFASLDGLEATWRVESLGTVVLEVRHDGLQAQVVRAVVALADPDAVFLHAVVRASRSWRERAALN